jgi:hypothetical protein
MNAAVLVAYAAPVHPVVDLVSSWHQFLLNEPLEKSLPPERRTMYMNEVVREKALINKDEDSLPEVRFWKTDEEWRQEKYFGLENDVVDYINEQQDSAFIDVDEGVILNFLEESELERINEPKTEALVSQSSHDLKPAAIVSPVVDGSSISGFPETPRNPLEKPGPSLSSIITESRTVSMESEDERVFHHLSTDNDDPDARKFYGSSGENLPEVGLWEAGKDWLNLSKNEKFEPVMEEVASDPSPELNPAAIISPVVEGSSIVGLSAKSHHELLDSFDLLSDYEFNTKDHVLLDKEMTKKEATGTLFHN